MTDAKPEMNPVLRGYVKDLVTLQTEYVAGCAAQLESEYVEDLESLAETLEDQIENSVRVLRKHVKQLQEGLREAYSDGMVHAPMQEVMAAIRSVFRNAAEFGSEHPVAAMVEDQHTMLSRMKVKYEILHAAALSAAATLLAEMALRHLQGIDQLIQQLTELIPKVVVFEISRAEKGFIVKAAKPAAENIRKSTD